MKEYEQGCQIFGKPGKPVNAMEFCCQESLELDCIKLSQI